MKALLVLFDKADRVFFEHPLEAESMENMLPALYRELFSNRKIEAQWKQAHCFHIASLRETASGQKPATKQSDLDFIFNCKRYNFTPAEINVALQLRTGLTYKEIGKVLGCSFNTVNSHVTHLYDKLCVKSRQAAINKLEVKIQAG